MLEAVHAALMLELENRMYGTPFFAVNTSKRGNQDAFGQ